MVQIRKRKSNYNKNSKLENRFEYLNICIKCNNFEISYNILINRKCLKPKFSTQYNK